MEHGASAEPPEEQEATTTHPSLLGTTVATNTTTTRSSGTYNAVSTTATICSTDWENVEDVHALQPPPQQEHATNPPLQTLLERGQLPTYKNQAETMITTTGTTSVNHDSNLSSLPVAIATNVYETDSTIAAAAAAAAADDDDDHDDHDREDEQEEGDVLRQLSQVDVTVTRSRHGTISVYQMDENGNVIPCVNQNSSNSRNVGTSTTTSISNTDSSMNRRLDAQYRHLIVASYEDHASFTTMEPQEGQDFVAATTTRNDSTNENDVGLCDDPNRVSNVFPFVRSTRRRWRYRHSLLLGLTTIAMAISVVAMSVALSHRAKNTSATPEVQQYLHPDDTEQSMMKMPKRNDDGTSTDDDSIAGMTSTTPLPIYSTDELYIAVDEYIQLVIDHTMNLKNDQMNDTAITVPQVLLTYRHGYPMSLWDVSRITNFSSVFDGQRNTKLQYYFNEDLSFWDVSNATNMFRMFAKLTSYSGYGLEYWNVQRVRNMRSMFHGAYIFQGNISDWDVSQVQNFERMFTDAYLFNVNISLWNTSSAESMSSMFEMAQSFDQDLSQWNVHRVNDFSEMFRKARNFNRDISKWNTSSATNMRRMFANAYMFNQDISGWDVQSVAQFSQMFMGATHFNYSLCHWSDPISQHYADQKINGIVINVSGMFNVTSCLYTADPKITAIATSDDDFGPFCHSCTA